MLIPKLRQTCHQYRLGQLIDAFEYTQVYLPVEPESPESSKVLANGRVAIDGTIDGSSTDLHQLVSRL